MSRSHFPQSVPQHFYGMVLITPRLFLWATFSLLSAEVAFVSAGTCGAVCSDASDVHGHHSTLKADSSSNHAPASSHATHVTKVPDSKNADIVSTFTTTYTTTFPRLRSSRWTDAVYTITEKLTGISKPTLGPNHIPLGFTTTLTKCTNCGPKSSLVTMTVPFRTPTLNPAPSVIICNSLEGHGAVPSKKGPPNAHSSSLSHAKSSSYSKQTSSKSLPSKSPGTTLSTIKASTGKSGSSSWTSTKTWSSAAAGSSTLHSTSAAYSKTSSSSSGTLSSSEIKSSSELPSSSSYPKTSSVTSSLVSQSSTQSSSTSASASSTALNSPKPTHLTTCEPTFSLSGVSESAFNPSDTPFTLVLSCGELDTSNYTVYVNWAPVVGTTNTSQTIDMPGLASGYAMVTVLALDTTGWPISQSFQLLFGDSSLQVVVIDASSNPVAGATIFANATTYVGVGQIATTDSTGAVSLINVPATTISLKGVTSDNQIAVDSIAGGSQSSVTLTLIPLHAPIQGDDGFDNNGTTGWTGGTVQTVSKRDVLLRKRDTELTVSTAGQPDVQSAFKVFSLGSGATSIFVNYQFQTDEVPGGYFGTQYNDYYSITIRADDGASTFTFHSMNELGLGAFDASGATQFFTTQMDISKDATAVEVFVAVSNVADALLDSQVIVRRVGICDKCATCDDCPDLAKCQDSCKAPAKDSCSFYSSCLEETVSCGSTGYALGYGEKTCNKFQNNLDKFSAAGADWVQNAEQCVQLSLVPFLSCDGTCDLLMDAGFQDLPECYVDNGLCSLEGMDYARILSILDDPNYKGALHAAIASQDGCSKSIVDAIDADIQQKLADAAAGTDYFQNLWDAHSLAVAREFYLMYTEEGKVLSVEDAVDYVNLVYNAAVAYKLDDPSLLTMDFFRYYGAYNDWKWKFVVGTIPPAWIQFAKFEGVQVYKYYADPAAPQITLDFAHTFATMAGVYVNGENTLGDITGWLGDLYTFYGDWQRSGVTSGSAFCTQYLGQNNKATSFPMEDLRGDADGRNIAVSLRSGGSTSAADAFAAVIEGGGYASRFSELMSGRFGSASAATAACMDYMTAGLISNPEAWKARRSLVNSGGAVKYPEDIPTADLQDFCNGWGQVLAGWAAGG